MDSLRQRLFVLEPQYRERVWGGQRLRAADPPVGEAWLAFGPSRVVGGPRDGRTLEELAAGHASALLGAFVAERFGRFPLLIKLIDCADWLSIQVHPDDDQARRMVGPDEFGKTEAWYFLDAEAGARIIAGVKSGVSRADLSAAIRSGRIREAASFMAVEGGDAVLVPAGMLHALGPGLLVYEVQQASDTTYRVYDWDRPQSAGRKLHVEESAEVALPIGPKEPARPRVSGDSGSARAIECRYFDLDLVRVSPPGAALEADTEGRAFHLLTVVDGMAELRCGSEHIGLGRFETALIAGSAGPYEVRANGASVTLLRATVPEEDAPRGRTESEDSQ